MTEENWPLIGPMAANNAFMVAALSGFGSMAACAAGRLCAAWVVGSDLPDYAEALSAARYDNEALMQELASAPSKGVL
jgi:glycine/D-amino acid oxidase-like deaminating enzyme